jgi:ketosteroid isomerase-like protein
MGTDFHEELDVTGEDAHAFAAQWAEAWNVPDVERVLTHFHDGIVFTSPTALAVVGVTTVRGKQALRDYWNAAVARLGSLRFSVDRVLWDATTREMAIVHEVEMAGRARRVSEHLTFDADGRVTRAEVFHGIEI